jgi:hypothetical protein
MTFSYLDPSKLKTAIDDSEGFMKPFYEPLPELERISRARPGRVPKGKPRITDGTSAAITRETPKNVIQQLPTGKVTVKNFPDIEKYVNATLTDQILPNANSGGTPYAKSKTAIKDLFRNGASIAYVFYGERNGKFGADYRRVYVKDVLFDKGKVSEFDSNRMFMVAWYTKSDLEAIKAQQEKLQQADREWKLDVLTELIEGAADGKTSDNQSEQDKKFTQEDNGYIKLYHCFQIGVGATFYTYSRKLDKVAKEWVNKDPRGVIPLHVLVAEEDYANPLGEPLLEISAGKQNLLDFDMQMYQYGRGMQYSPTLMKWGPINSRSVKMQPDGIINMGPVGQSDIKALNIDNSAIASFGNNYGLIKSQILNETGRTAGATVSAESGDPQSSKTAAGVKDNQNRLGISDNDLRKVYELWQGRIYETMLNLEFAHGKGKKELDLKMETIKQLKLQREDTVTIDYDKDMGPISFSVDASSSQAADNEKESERLLSVLEVKAKFGVPEKPSKQMALLNQVIQNSGVDDPERLLYSDEEMEAADAEYDQQKQMAQQAAQQQQAMAEQQAAMAGQAQAPVSQPGEEQVPPEAGQPVEETPAEPQGLDEEEAQLVEGLQERGAPDEVIAGIVQVMRNGGSEEDVAKLIQGGDQ